MNILKLLANRFSKKTNFVTQEDRESFFKVISEEKNKTTKKEFKKIESYEIDGHLFKLGDKVICRTNEPYPLIIGKIIEFWDKEGRLEKAVPVIRNNSNGKKFNVHGIVKPFSKELLETLKSMKPLEQWNYFVPEEVRYTEEEMLKKEESFKKREKFLSNKK